ACPRWARLRQRRRRDLLGARRTDRVVRHLLRHGALPAATGPARETHGGVRRRHAHDVRARDGGNREPSPRPFLAAAAAVLAVALVVRVARLTEGLPAFLDEAQPLRQALKMWRAENVVDWNPHFFVYPSLAIYFHLALQWIQIGMGKAL